LAAKEKQKSKSLLSLLLRIAIAVFACWIIFKDIDFNQLAGRFAELRISILVLACLIFSGGMALIGFRWWVFLRAQKIEIPLSLAVRLTFLGQFFTNFMPSAVGGDLVRAWYVSRHSHKKLQAALGVAVDHIVGLFSTFILALTSYLFFMRGKGLLQIYKKDDGGIGAFFAEHSMSPQLMLVLGVIVLGIGFILAGCFDLKQFFRKLYHHFIHLLDQFKEVVLVYYHHPLVLLLGLSVTIFLQSMVIISYWLIGRDLEMTASLQYYFVFFPLVWVIGAIPVSIAGIGILEGGVVFLFVQFAGADPLDVATLALCQRLTWIVGSIPGLIIHLRGSHRVASSPSE
jgi:uncharacterized membrane protein YbhN (UPF0104 family)